MATHQRTAALVMAVGLGVMTAGCSAGSVTALPTTVTVAVTQPPTTATVTVSASDATEEADVLTTSAAGGTTEGQVGQPASFQLNMGSNANLGTVTLNSYDWAADSPSTIAGNPAAYVASPEHDSFLVLDVTVTATKGHVNSDTFGWSATGADGTEYGAASSSNFEPRLPGYKPLSVGESASGVVVLDVQRGPVTVTWAGEFGQQPVSWSVPA